MFFYIILNINTEWHVTLYLINSSHTYFYIRNHSITLFYASVLINFNGMFFLICFIT